MSQTIQCNMSISCSDSGKTPMHVLKVYITSKGFEQGMTCKKFAPIMCYLQRSYLLVRKFLIQLLVHTIQYVGWINVILKFAQTIICILQAMWCGLATVRMRYSNYMHMSSRGQHCIHLVQWGGNTNMQDWNSIISVWNHNWNYY